VKRPKSVTTTGRPWLSTTCHQRKSRRMPYVARRRRAQETSVLIARRYWVSTCARISAWCLDSQRNGKQPESLVIWVIYRTLPNPVNGRAKVFVLFFTKSVEMVKERSWAIVVTNGANEKSAQCKTSPLAPSTTTDFPWKRCAQHPSSQIGIRHNLLQINRLQQSMRHCFRGKPSIPGLPN